MKYTPQERLKIGQQIYTNEISSKEAVQRYGISPAAARDYMRLYRDVNNLPPKNSHEAKGLVQERPSSVYGPRQGLKDFESMTREQLIQELVKAQITEARLKKGYEVKGDGTVIRYTSRNTR